MEDYLGETPPPLSPVSPNRVYRSPRLASEIRNASNMLTPPRMDIDKRVHRASMISIMSGLGAIDAPPSPSQTRSPSGSFLNTRKKMYNFFGHRPPSELISSHMTEYFPNLKKKDLDKAARNSQLRLSSGSSVNRLSSAPSESISLDLDGRRKSMDKMSRPVSGRRASPPPRDTIVEENETDDGVPRPSVDFADDESAASHESLPHLLPPIEPSNESLSESLKAYSPTMIQGLGKMVPYPSLPRPKSMRRGSAGSTRSRLSMLSQHRLARDRADNASLLTVDEITAEVEQRRASTITFGDDDDDEDLVTPLPIGPGVPQDEVSANEDELEWEEDVADDEDEEEEEEDKNAEMGMAFYSTGCKCGMGTI
jgi:mitogen-activated protein kinase kinase kinase